MKSAVTAIKLTESKSIKVGPIFKTAGVFLEVTHRDGMTGTVEAIYLTNDQAEQLAAAIMVAREGKPLPAGLLGVFRHVGQG